jgi:hypothetical protein
MEGYIRKFAYSSKLHGVKITDNITVRSQSRLHQAFKAPRSDLPSLPQHQAVPSSEMEMNNEISRVEGLLLRLPNLKITTRDELSRFTLFPKLPRELRDLVWQQVSYNNPRNIFLQFYESVFNSYRDFVRSPMTIPPLLHTCHDAREEGLKHYTLHRVVRVSETMEFSSPFHVYINFEVFRLG